MKPVVRPISDVSAAEVQRSTGARIQVLLGPDDDLPRFYTRLFTLDPGGSIPAHRHGDIEHEQVVLEGEMWLWLDGVEHRVPAGTAVFIPAGVAHAYENRGEVPVRFLCMVPGGVPYDVEWV